MLFLRVRLPLPGTLQTRDQFARLARERARPCCPELARPEQDAKYGAQLHDRDPGLCCGIAGGPAGQGSGGLRRG
ncbi:hypothetical protein QJS66_19735 [Kocuria rhizophila]|nr:hypothetical protein QJS66_19735 [Kocuria rhizophila]